MTDRETNEKLFLAIGRLEGKVDALINLNKKLEEHTHKLEQRLRTLEMARSYTLGMVAVVGAVVSASISYLTRLWS